MKFKSYIIITLCLSLLLFTACDSKVTDYSSDSSPEKEKAESSSFNISPIIEDEFIDYYIIPLLEASLTNEDWSTKEHINSQNLIFFYLLNYLYPNLEDAQKKYILSESESSIFIPVKDIVLWLNTSFDNITKEMLIKENSNYLKENDTIEIAIGGIGSPPYPTIEDITFSQADNQVEATVVTLSPFDGTSETLSIVLVYDISSSKYKYQSLKVQ